MYRCRWEGGRREAVWRVGGGGVEVGRYFGVLSPARPQTNSCCSIDVTAPSWQRPLNHTWQSSIDLQTPAASLPTISRQYIICPSWINWENLFKHVPRGIRQRNPSESWRSTSWFPGLGHGTVAAVVRDSWSHVCGPVLAWPLALRWWMAADCSDSLGAWLVCCAPHNGLTHRELVQCPSLSRSHWNSLFDPFHWLCVFFDGDAVLFSRLRVFLRCSSRSARFLLSCRC